MTRATVHRLLERSGESEIQKGIPIPNRNNGPQPQYRAVLGALEIGDSFFLRGKRRTPTMVVREVRRIGIRVTSRRIGNGIRIWRTA